MPIVLVLPIAIFVALFVVFAALLRRIGILLAEQKETNAFRTSVRDLAGRIDATLGAIIGQIDAVRRQQVEAETIAGTLDSTIATLLTYGEEARALTGPRVIVAPKAELIAELDRADRALEMVEYGCSIMTSQDHGARYSEAQTAIKRGYLNVLHSRDAIARHAADIAASRPADELHWLSGRKGTGRPGPV
jgi:hypothetical protein